MKTFAQQQEKEVDMEKFRKMVIIGLVLQTTSQLYINFITDGFRISASVIIFPLLLIYCRDLNPIHTAATTASVVFIIRLCILLCMGADMISAIISVYPGSIFYIIYGIIFKMKISHHSYSLKKTFTLIILCDFVSNIFEVLLRVNLNITIEIFSYILILFSIASIRALVVIIIISLITNYKILLTKEEHEVRYQNLILLTSSLKSEIYFMMKNSEDIENVMSNSYLLYERLSDSDQDDDVKAISLNITKNIHEIKKDYLRVIKGIDGILTDKIQLSEMSIKDILYILKENTYRILEEKNRNIYLDFRYGTNFMTNSHFQLMSILQNLVSNAIEAVDYSKKNNYVKIYHTIAGDCHIFKVSDNGLGISPQNLIYIYNPGFSTKFDYDTGYLYRGIGLTHVKNLINNHFKGTIDVTSEDHVGTEFEIRIPRETMEV